jgi:MFS family permease
MARFDEEPEKALLHHMDETFVKSVGVQIGAVVGLLLGLLLAACIGGVGAYFVRNFWWLLALLLVPIGLIAGALVGRVCNLISESRRLKRRRKREARAEYGKRRREGRR